MLDFRMETFMEVCRLMNYTKAAEQLNITQPAVSQHIKYIEEQYNTKLFEMKGKRLNLTEDGRLLLSTLTTVKHDDMYLKDIFATRKHKTSRINVGVTLTIGEYVIGNLVADYLKRYPESQINVIVANTGKLLDKLNSGEIDCALVEGYFEKSEYEYKVYSQEQYIAVCSNEHDIAKKGKKVNLSDLFEENLIVREKGSGTREILERNLEEKNYSINDFSRITMINNINAIKTVVMNNGGITFLYDIAVRKEIDNGALHPIIIEDMNICHNFDFIWRKGSVFAGEYQRILGE